MRTEDFQEGIWLVDFEFHPQSGIEGNPPEVVCMVARRWPEGPTIRIWKDELLGIECSPFSTGNGALFVAYFACAEMDCFIQLGWPMPSNLLDLYCEFRLLTNGTAPAHGNGLVGALLHFGLPSIDGEEKRSMRDLILSRGPWSISDRKDILDYCESDVTALGHLMNAMIGLIDLPRALIRGRYMQAVSSIQAVGVPIDSDTLGMLKAEWMNIKDQLIQLIDKDYNVFDGRTFKSQRWEDFLIRKNIPRPRLASGKLDLSDQTFREMAKSYPVVSPMRELRSSLSEMRLSSLQVGSDGRNRCVLSPFSSRTSRNQPSNSKFIFGPSVWIRGLIQPKPGFGLAYVDWSQQEFGIAAALSEDKVMMDAYQSGDPYLAFAKQAGAVPQDATKKSHESDREQFKACVLAVQYGMGEESLALRINQPVARARQLLSLHRQTYKTFWKWSDSAVDEAILGGRLWSTFGWQINTSLQPNPRSLRNFPMQANGAEMLRIACIGLVESNIRVCAPVHDALLIEAPIDQLDETVNLTQKIMKKASRIVLNGFELSSDAKIIRYPDRYFDKRGLEMWNTVMGLIDGPVFSQPSS